MNFPATPAVTAIVEPTERSSPPAISTIVIPIAKKLTVIMALMMFVTLPPVAKLGYRTDIAIIATTRSSTIPNEGS
jgi:hypothetical protein